MIRLLIFILVVLGLGAGFAWLADRPGDVLINWQGEQIQMSVVVAAGLIVALVVAVMLAWWIVRTLLTSPHLIRRHLRARKRDRGYQALSTGLIAAGAGDAVTARRMNKRTQGLLSARQEPLIHLLEAQTALIEGDHDAARKKFESMAEDPETRALALRGLYLEARRVGADEAARHYVERAVDASPQLPWAAQAALELRSREADWDGAVRLLEKQRMAHIVKREEAERKKAVLLTARAMKRLDGDPRSARDDALEALRLAPDLVPAAVTAAKALFREDNVRKGSKVLEKSWRTGPHPEVAEAYVRARIGDSVLDRLKRAERLEQQRPNHIESLLVVARAALDAQQFKRAREKAEAAARQQSRESIYLLLADIEEAETGDQGRVRHWLAQAVRAQPDPAWTADGYVAERWAPVSPVTGKLDAFVWRVPLERLSGQIEAGKTTDQIEQAIRTLPPVREQITEAKAPSVEDKAAVDAEIITPAEEPQPTPPNSEQTPASSRPDLAPEEPPADAIAGKDATKDADERPATPPSAAGPKPDDAHRPDRTVNGSGEVKANEPARPDDSLHHKTGDASAGRGARDDEKILSRPPDDPGVEKQQPSKRRFGLF